MVVVSAGNPRGKEKRMRSSRPWILSLVVMLGSYGGALAQALVPTVESAYFRDIRSLDPALAPGSPDWQLVSNIYSGLVRYQYGSNEVEPDLAHRWEVSGDGTVYTFYLREDVYWHGGYGRFTASDVKFSLERVLDEALGSRWRAGLQVVERIEVIDDFTVALHLSAPSAGFLSGVLAFMPGYVVNERAIADFGDEYPTNPIGTGPYMLAEYVPREYLELVAFPDHYRGEPEVKRVRLNVGVDEAVAILALQRGDLNYMIVRGQESINALRDRPGVVLTETPTTGYVFYSMNTRRPPLDDVRVRRAIAHAIDKQLFVETVYEGGGVVANSIIPAGMFGHDPDVPAYAYDPVRARELLSEAGYPSGRRLSVLYNSGSGINEQMAAVLQEWLSAVGIDVELVGLEIGGWTARRQAGDYDIIISGISGADPDRILSEGFHSASFPPNGVNHSFYADIDDWIEEQRSAVDPEVRRRLLREIQLRVAEDVPEIPFATGKLVTAHAGYITGDLPNTSDWIVRFESLSFLDLTGCTPCRGDR